VRFAWQMVRHRFASFAGTFVAITLGVAVVAGATTLYLSSRPEAPNSALLTSQTRWSYFMLWSEQLRGNNSNAEIQAAYFHPKVLNQGEVRF